MFFWFLFVIVLARLAFFDVFFEIQFQFASDDSTALKLRHNLSRQLRKVARSSWPCFFSALKAIAILFVKNCERSGRSGTLALVGVKATHVGTL